MIRLIDADKLKHVIHCAYSDDLEILEKIDNQPTAFDADKVIEQIEYRRANFDCKLCKYNDDENTICSEDCSDALIDILLDIVKGGGVE